MSLDHQLHLTEAIQAACETPRVDFKRSFDTTSQAEWIELVKDLVSIANSGGGTICVGLDDNGSHAGIDLTPLNSIDPAELTDKIARYTDIQFSDFRIAKSQAAGGPIVCIEIGPARIPMVFTRPGTYQVDGNRQKTAFGNGTLYFRHGAKSEPADSHDLRQSFERLTEQTREAWLSGIRKVVEAPPGAEITIVANGHGTATIPGTGPVQLTNDPAAPLVRQLSVDDTHPYRQKELVKAVNRRLDGARTVTPFDIVCIRRVHESQKNATFCYTLNFTSPQYSDAFVEWILGQYAADPEFFDKTRAAYYVAKQRTMRNDAGAS
jgi:Schlafen, AlbA_2